MASTQRQTSLTQQPMSESDLSPTSDASQPIAAVDLGSNSFHMIVARPTGGQFQVVDRLREPVRLGAGLDARSRLTEEARARALDCLQRFGQRLRALPHRNVRVLGTNTLRKARQAQDFIVAAEQALGHPVEVISGIEEARLIYLGVSHDLADDGSRRLVVDIGGGSTELIVGEHYEPIRLESLYMGCVGMSVEYFPHGAINKDNMRRARVAAQRELEGIAHGYRALGWQQAVGASGTIKAVARILQEQSWSESGITAAGLKKLRKALVNAAHVDRLNLKGLSAERAPVLPGGVAVVSGIFDALDIERMEVSEGALREGALYDLLGRIGHEDVRDRTVALMAERYRVDREQALRVERTAVACLRQVDVPWGLQNEEHELILRWASRLHEVGLAVAHNQFHKHGAYLARYSDLPGFSRDQQQMLAVLIRGHRRKFPIQLCRELPDDDARVAMRLCVLLRLGALLHRSRSDQPLPDFRLRADDNALELAFPEDWLDRHALTAADLDEEARFLAAAGVDLRFS
jgi:exopolyphosphatase/guanosine-5'-triphosphate,3'-diphosphate pyrophosphatase